MILAYMHCRSIVAQLGFTIELHFANTQMPMPSRPERETLSSRQRLVRALRSPTTAAVFRIARLLRYGSEVEQAARLWSVALDWYSSTNSAFDALMATKVATSEADVVTINPTQAHRLIRPVYTWLALDDALDRHGIREGQATSPVTLGGVDEQKVWDLWVARPHAPAVASIFVPRLESPTDKADLWQYAELRRDTPYGVRDLERFLARSAGLAGRGAHRVVTRLPTASTALASYTAEPDLPSTSGGPATWREVSEDLGRRPDEVCASISEVVATWFYHAGQMT